MSNPLADRITEHLGTVARMRALRDADPDLARRVVALKAYQASRFARSYADLLADARYGAAARFFLEELYGPQEFHRRDAQFGRVVPALVRLLLVPLHRLSGLPPALDLALKRLWGAPQQAAVALCGIVASTSLMVAMAVMVASFRGPVDDWLVAILPSDIYLHLEGAEGGGLWIGGAF